MSRHYAERGALAFLLPLFFLFFLADFSASAPFILTHKPAVMVCASPQAPSLCYFVLTRVVFRLTARINSKL